MILQEGADRTSGYAIASLALGVVGVMFPTLVLSILAIVFGIKARKEIRTGAAAGNGVAAAGIALGWVGIAIQVAGILVFLLWLGSL